MAGGSGEGDGEKPGAPIIPAIAYPSHVLYVPWLLWKWSFAGALIAAFSWGTLVTGEGVNMFAFVVAFLILLGYCAYRFRRDPHIHLVWNAYFFGKPHAAWRGTRSPDRLRRRVNRFIAA